MARPDLIGHTIGNYRVVRRLGAGGMGEVYEALQPAIGARVAIKVLNADAADPAGARRFLIEAQAVNRIQHDGVIKVIDAGYTDDGRPYLVMEFLDGASLAEVMAASRRVPLGTACRIVADVLAALAAAHAEGIVHRDLKPHNVFLTRSGRTVVLDFGVAKLLDNPHAVSLTLSGAILGTPAYMAPEQIQGEAVDGRADLYAVGVVLYELVTGRRPFEGDQTADLLAAHIERRPPPPRAIRPDVPVAVQGVLISALAKDPGERFQTAEAMRSALLQAAALLPPAEFLPIDLPAAPSKRTPSIPPTDTGPYAAAQAELAEAGPPTVPARKGPAMRPDRRARADGDALEHATTQAVRPPAAERAPEPPVRTSSPPARRGRGPMIAVAVVLGGAVVVAAFLLGRQSGSAAGKAADPLDAALAPTRVADAAAAPDAAPGAGPDVPPEVAEHLVARRLHVLDLRREVVDGFRTATAPGTPAAQVAAALADLVAAVDRTPIDAALVAAKATRVRARLDRRDAPIKIVGYAARELARADRAVAKADPIAANEHLWRAEWWLEHHATPPW